MRIEADRRHVIRAGERAEDVDADTGDQHRPAPTGAGCISGYGRENGEGRAIYNQVDCVPCHQRD
jgi:hypothetical protein